MHKIAIVVGHNATAQGAERRDTSEPEYQFYGRIAGLIEKLAMQHPSVSVKTFRRKKGGGYRKEISRVYGEVDDWNADAAIELHFNASDNPQANGCETLSSGSKGSLALSTAINDDMVAALNMKNRGIKAIPKSGRGGGSLHAGLAPAALIEPFFATNASDLAKTSGHENEMKLAGSILSGAMRAIGAKAGGAVSGVATDLDPDTASNPHADALLKIAKIIQDTFGETA